MTILRKIKETLCLVVASPYSYLNKTDDSETKPILFITYI